MPYTIGSFHVQCYHNCTNAAAIHAELKRRHIDAAVVDHAFIISPLQLAVALFRVETSADAASAGVASAIPAALTAAAAPPLPSASPQQPSSARRVSDSRQMFAALSLSRNLDRILQVLPPGPHTTSVVVLCRPLSCLRSAADTPAPSSAATGSGTVEDVIHLCVQRTNSTAQPHSFAPITEPFWCGAAFAFTDTSKVASYYGVSESLLATAERGMTRAEVQRVCANADSPAARAQVLRWHALHVVVTTLLSACTA
ncbi:hypothetical protein NESM_000867400 [Novymonas esmeraldas]|uniref:Uncharacterized protein n=1 Tax=Novymonas esmeraldas TaxID=1808958 RepID=A0AAW0EZP9_9TRYP